MRAITAVYLLLIIILSAGTMLLDQVPKEANEPYVFTCQTDMECQEEEEACLASGECVHQR